MSSVESMEGERQKKMDGKKGEERVEKRAS